MKTTLKEGLKPYIVAVFDDRFPALAMRNVRVPAAKGSTPEQIAEKALRTVYLDEAIRKEHCTHVQIFEADITWHVLDGNIFTPVLFREPNKKTGEVQHA